MRVLYNYETMTSVLYDFAVFFLGQMKYQYACLVVVGECFARVGFI